MKYLIYLRVSSDKQNEEMQRHHCLGYINSINKTNSPIVQYADPECSTLRTKMQNRVALQQMLREVGAGDTVVIFKLDRLSRDIIEMVTIHRTIKSKKATVYSLHEPNIDDWMLGIFASMAQKERENISERTKAKLSEKKAKGERLGHVPYGHMVTEGKLQVNPEEANVLKVMYNYRVHNQLTFRQIADKLNKQGMRNRSTSTRTEVTWNHGSTSRVYKNYLNLSCEPSLEVLH